MLTVTALTESEIASRLSTRVYVFSPIPQGASAVGSDNSDFWRPVLDSRDGETRWRREILHVLPGSPPVECPIHIGRHLRLFDPKANGRSRVTEQPTVFTFDTIELPPERLAVLSSQEYLVVGSGVSGTVEGRSALGRVGLHISSGLAAPTFRGRLNLELFLSGPGPLVLREGQPVASLHLRHSQYALPRAVQREVRPYGDRLGLRVQWLTEYEPRIASEPK